MTHILSSPFFTPLVKEEKRNKGNPIVYFLFYHSIILDIVMSQMDGIGCICGCLGFNLLDVRIKLGVFVSFQRHKQLICWAVGDDRGIRSRQNKQIG